MRQFVYPILDLNNKIWPQMIDVDCPVQHLLKPLAKNLKLPEELNYVLIPAGGGQPLDGRYTLAQARIPVGAQLYLRPVRDTLLKQLLDKLYDQAKDELKDQLMERAKDKLRQIFHLDPSYPDPLHLKERVLGQPASPQQSQPQQFQQQQYQQQFQQARQAAYPPLRPKSASKVGWVIAGVLGGGVVVVGGIIAVAALVLIPMVRGLLDQSIPSTRNEPVLGTGDVQVTLRWDAPVDLDLHVIDPSGQEIWFSSPSSTTGGRLDVDANGNCQTMSASPVENVFWPTGGAPSGSYQVSVAYYMSCGFDGPVSYEVTIKQNNQVVNTLTGTVYTEKDFQLVTNFTR